METGISSEQRIEQVTSLRGLTGLPVLRAAIVAAERSEDRAALTVALIIRARALQALQIAIDAVEISTHLRNLAVERRALRVRTAAEEIEEAGIVAVLTPCLRDQAIKVALLLGGGLFKAADLIGLGRIVGTAAIHRGKLLLETLADLSL